MTQTTTTVPATGAVTIPEAAATVPHHTPDQVDRAVADVAARKDAWLALGLTEKMLLLDQMIHDTLATVEEWNAVGLQLRQVAPDAPAGGEEIATGPMQIVRHARLLRETLRSIRDTGDVSLPRPPTTRPDGQVTVPVFPTSTLDAATYVGHKAELWLEPHVTLDTVRTATLYKDPPSEGKVCFVIAAGNFGASGPSDALHKLFVDGEVCVIKMNPVNERIGPFVERALTPFIREGFVRVVYGGVDTGVQLSSHPQVDTIHMTASDKTHDAVVFGVGEEGARRKAANDPINTRPVTSELGAINPVLIIPGPWSDADIDFHAQYLASMLAMNAGFTCLCPRVIVTDYSWDRRNDLLDAIRRHLAAAPQRHPYYSGARERWDLYLDAYPQAETFGTAEDGAVPWTLIANLDASQDQMAFRVEPFNGIFSEVPLWAPSRGEWLDDAVDFCNDRLWGTLSCTVLAHPKTLKDPAGGAAVERALARLQYGSIGLNTWGGTGYGLMSTSWGAFPGHPLNDVQSGRGVVHNTYLVEDVQKTVIRAPFRMGKKAPMAYDWQTFPSLVRRLVQVEAQGDWTQLPGIVGDGIRA
jgi:acyl-CoA reductase-like NAD-dependent aldehyde dehydrogenase